MAKRDYYEVLGVGRDANAEEIKSAYRKIALRNHPDRNPGDAEAEARFKEAANAYAVLGDPEKRARYDRFGHAGVDGAATGGFTDVDEIFRSFGDLFGGAGGGFFEQFFGGGRTRGGARRGASLRVDLELTLEEVATGVRKELDIQRSEPCATCRGSGAKPGTEPRRCQTCGGHGQVVLSQGFMQLRQTCPTCRGTGSLIDEHCSQCRGRGVSARTVPITITIPAGIEEGHVERIRGQGEPGQGGGPPGDLIVVIHVEPHPLFVRRGDDLFARVTVRFRQAVLGDAIEVPTILGETVTLKIPPGTQPGERLRIRGHGLPRADGYGRGNLLVEVHVEVPRKVTAEQQELLERFDALEVKRSKSSARKKGILDKVKDIFQP